MEDEPTKLPPIPNNKNQPVPDESDSPQPTSAQRNHDTRIVDPPGDKQLDQYCFLFDFLIS